MRLGRVHPGGPPKSTPPSSRRRGGDRASRVFQDVLVSELPNPNTLDNSELQGFIAAFKSPIPSKHKKDCLELMEQFVLYPKDRSSILSRLQKNLQAYTKLPIRCGGVEKRRDNIALLNGFIDTAKGLIDPKLAVTGKLQEIREYQRLIKLMPLRDPFAKRIYSVMNEFLSKPHDAVGLLKDLSEMYHEYSDQAQRTAWAAHTLRLLKNFIQNAIHPTSLVWRRVVSEWVNEEFPNMTATLKDQLIATCLGKPYIQKSLKNIFGDQKYTIEGVKRIVLQAVYEPKVWESLIAERFKSMLGVMPQMLSWTDVVKPEEVSDYLTNELLGNFQLRFNRSPKNNSSAQFYPYRKPAQSVSLVSKSDQMPSRIDQIDACLKIRLEAYWKQMVDQETTRLLGELCNRRELKVIREKLYQHTAPDFRHK